MIDAFISYGKQFMKNTIILFFVIALMAGCKENRNSYNVDVSDISIPDIRIHRYGNALFGIDRRNLKDELKALSGEYRFFLDANLDDPLNLIQINEYIKDPKLRELHKTTSESFSDITGLEQELTEAFRHYKYYYPEEQTPRVYSYISGLQYESPIIFADSVLLIGLDNYLGENFKPYREFGLPLYITKRMQAAFISTACMKAIAASKLADHPPARTLLDEMILAGKRLYFTDAMLPGIQDTLKIAYTEKQLNWCIENESNTWAFLVENALLYSADFQTTKKFMQDGPFTTGFGNDSSPRIGEWLGWQIVRKYMNNNPEVSLDSLLTHTNAQQILKKSGYKPVR